MDLNESPFFVFRKNFVLCQFWEKTLVVLLKREKSREFCFPKLFKLKVLRVMFFGFLLFLFVTATLSNGMGSEEKVDPPIKCFNYTLQNECSTLVGDVNIDHPIQKQIFDSISLNISDIRMVPWACRRALIWFTCRSSFPPCPLPSKEEEVCFQSEGCQQVSDICFGVFDLALDCSDSNEDTNPSCSMKVEEELKHVTATPIRVDTCLGEEREVIPCCFDPYIQDNYGECVMECLRYQFGKTYELAFDIWCFVMAWLGGIFYVIAVIPLLVMRVDMSYPNYVWLLGLGSWIMFCLLITGNVFQGGPAPYFCGDEVDFEKAFVTYAVSTKAGVQFAFYFMFVMLTLCLWSISSFNTLCFMCSTKFTFLQKLVRRPVSRAIEIPMILGSFLIALTAFLYSLIYFFTIQSDYFVLMIPSPFTYAPVPRDPYLLEPLKIGVMFTSSIICLFFFFSVVLAFKVNLQFLFIQWRALFLSSYVLVMYFFLAYYMFFATTPYEAIFEYAGCVSSNPRQDPPPCSERNQSSIGYLLWTIVLLLSSPLLGGVLFLTNSLVSGWWTKLIFSRQIIRSESELHQQGGMQSQFSRRDYGSLNGDSRKERRDTINGDPTSPRGERNQLVSTTSAKSP